MAYKTSELKKEALVVIKNQNLFFHTDIFEYLGIDSTTYYAHFPTKSSDYKEMDKLLRANRTKTKNGIRNKWYRSENATMTLALYKLLGNDDERRKLAQQYTEHSVGEGVRPITVEIVDVSKNTNTD